MGAAREPLDPRFALRAPGDDSKRGRLALLPSSRTPRPFFLPSSRTLRVFFLSSSRTARVFFLSSSRTPRPFSLPSSRTARRAEPGSRQALRASHWIPGSRCARPGMTAKSKTPSRTRTPFSAVIPAGALSFDVIPDGPKGRAGIQTGAAPMRTLPLRTARGQRSPPSHWVPGSACGGPGMTAKSKTPSRTPPSLF